MFCFMFALQIRGHTVEEYISSARDRSKNARERSILAGFEAWKEHLRADQISFDSQRILTL